MVIKKIQRFVVESPQTFADCEIPDVPLGSEILKTLFLGDFIYLFIEVDIEETDLHTLYLRWIRSEDEYVDENMKYIDTLQVGYTTWHLFVMVGVIDLAKFADAGGYSGS